MFNYTKETIINNKEIIIAGTDNNGLGKGVVAVKRAGNYVLDNIVDGKIYKTVGTKGDPATATITYENLGTNDVARILIHLTTPGTEFVEFASPNWQEFGKPIIIETKAKNVKELEAAIRLALPVDNKLFDTVCTDTAVVITAAESWMDFAEVKYELVTFGACSDCGVRETITDKSANVVITNSTPEFATAKWIVENLRFPSHPNLRYAPLYADEAPVAGTVYTQYSFQYKVTRSVPGGLSAVGQVVDSIVTIVFYVAPDAIDAFEGAFGYPKEKQEEEVMEEDGE